MSKIVNSRSYLDENAVSLASRGAKPLAPLGGVSKQPLQAAAQPRTVLGDMTNRPREDQNGAKDQVKKAVQPILQPVVVPQQQAYLAPVPTQQPQHQHIDAMDTTLEDSMSDLSLTPPEQQQANSSSSSSSALTNNSVLSTSVSPFAVDANNAQYVNEYIPEILEYWRTSESRRAPSPNYMSKQTDINAKMREILIDWMVEVQIKFKLKTETLYLSIHLLDRFLERRAVNRNKLQLVGCTALLLASKYEEIYAPEINDFVCISDRAYTKEQILAMEGIMLNALGFNLTVPLACNFIQFYAKQAATLLRLNEEQTDALTYLTYYFTEITLQNYTFLSFMPSVISASALYLAVHTLNMSWNSSLTSLINMMPNHPTVQACCMEIIKMIEASNTSKYKAVKKKYSQPKFAEVAKYNIRNPFA